MISLNNVQDKTLRELLENKDFEKIKEYLEENPNVDISTKYETVFRYVCMIGELNFAKYLLEFSKKRMQNNFLSNKEENNNAITSTYPEIDISAMNDDAFRKAIYYGHFDIAEWLLEIKPEIKNTVNYDYAFHFTGLSNGNLDTAKYLFNLKPELKNTIQQYQSFEYSCYNGHINVAKWIVEIKPDILNLVNMDSQYEICLDRDSDDIKYFLQILKCKKDCKIEILQNVIFRN
jgi:hypothetical protein